MRLIKISSVMGETVAKAIYAKRVEASADGFIRMLKEAGIEKISKKDFSRIVLATFESLAAGMTPQQKGAFDSLLQKVRTALESQMQGMPGAQLSLWDARNTYVNLANQFAAEFAGQGVQLPDWPQGDKTGPVPQAVGRILDDIQARQDVQKGTGRVVTPQQKSQEELAKEQLKKPGMGKLRPIPKRPPPPPPPPAG